MVTKQQKFKGQPRSNRTYETEPKRKERTAERFGCRIVKFIDEATTFVTTSLRYALPHFIEQFLSI